MLGLSLESVNKKTDTELVELFSPGPAEVLSSRIEDLYAYFPQMERELKKTGITIQIMWERNITFH